MISMAECDSEMDASDISKNLALSFILVLPFPSLKLSMALVNALYS